MLYKNKNMEKCYCGLHIPKYNCCEPFLKNDKFPTTAESLMRSRYSAYVTGNIDYVLSTHHKSTRPIKEKRDILNWTLSVKWLGLTVHSKKLGQLTDQSGYVHFTAVFLENGQINKIEENSYFVKENGRWFYTPK